jgi:hypothetical protein
MVCSYCKEQKKWKFIYYRIYKLQTSTPYVKALNHPEIWFQLYISEAIVYWCM